MKIHLNGEEYLTGKGITLSELLREIGAQPERVAVEVNLRIIKKPDYDNYEIQEGDQVEIVSFVGGGL